MKIALILDPLSSLKVKKDSSIAMMAEAARRGHELYVMMQEGLMWKGGRVVGENLRLTLTGEKDHWYRAAPPIETPLAEFDAVLMRKDPPFDSEYVTSTWLLELAQREGARVFNDPRAVRDHNEKLAIARFARFAAPTLVARLPEQIHEFIDANADVIVKPLDGMGGQSVFRVTDSDPNRYVIVETLTRHGARTIMAQRFIPEIRDGDKRILLIGGKPVPYCLARIPKPGETRGNLAAGGSGVARPLSARDAEIANAIAPELERQGLLLVGLDVIGDYLTEVNVTSPTCFREIADQTGFDVAAMFIDALEAACGR
ncbi:MAG: glutathione synthase [Betaproteobacteria bacterium]|nr:glutathione synthase [Betaproteobacteria bacterium]MBI2959508.1 glutathione synthase [Betaproteobacteria bacterium]